MSEQNPMQRVEDRGGRRRIRDRRVGVSRLLQNDRRTGRRRRCGYDRRLRRANRFEEDPSGETRSGRGRL